MKHQVSGTSCSSRLQEVLNALANAGLIWLKQPDYSKRLFQFQLADCTFTVEAKVEIIGRVLIALEEIGGIETDIILGLKTNCLGNEQFTSWRLPNLTKGFGVKTITLNQWLKKEQSKNQPWPA